jgi:hypothetical protein
MGTLFKPIRIAALLLLITWWMPQAASAFTKGEFKVSPQRIELGTVFVAPGTDAEFTFNISVTGGPRPVSTGTGDDAQEVTSPFLASSDRYWLTVSPAQGGAPESVAATVTVFSTMQSGEWEGSVSITSGLDTAMDPVLIPVTMTVVRSSGDALVLTPTRLDLVVTEKHAAPQTFPVRISGSNPFNTGFDWQAQSEVPWLTLSQYSGNGNSQISLTLNPQLLTVTRDTDQGDVSSYGSEGSVTFFSSQMAEPVTLTVNVWIDQSFDLSVHPAQLYWSIEKQALDAGTFLDPQVLQVFSGPVGWTVVSDVHFLDINGGPAFMSAKPYGQVSVSPVPGLVQGMGYGYHTANITITDRYSRFFRKVPVTIHVRYPGEPVSLPVPGPEVYQNRPDYSMIETAAANRLHLLLPVPDSMRYFATPSACTSAGGLWLDPDNIPGNLNEYCTLNQYVYVLMEFPEKAPGRIYAWNRFGEFTQAYIDGIKVPGADAHTYADGPVPVIPVGPVQLLEYHGTMVISTRIGRNLNSAVETQRIQINLRTPEGRWNVTESFRGQMYTYDNTRLLELNRIPGASGHYSGSWGNIPVSVQPGDGISMLYQMDFSLYGLRYTYQVQALSANQMSGVWRFAWPGGASQWETFQAHRQRLPLLPALP